MKKRITKYLKNQEETPYTFKNRRRLHMALFCWVLGRYPIVIFPQLILKYQGSIEILIPVILITVLFIIPLTFMALGLSQYSRRGPINVWDAAPIWRGIGIVGIICLFVSCLTTTTLTSYFLYYSFYSLSEEPPWLKCDVQDFKLRGCFTYSENRSINIDCVEAFSEEHCRNIIWKNSAQTFWDEIAKFGTDGPRNRVYRANMLPYEIVVVVIIFICIRTSSKSIEIFAPFFVIFPTIAGGILIVFSFLHPGVLRSLELIFVFKFRNALSVKFWTEVLVISLSSIGYCYGGLSTFAMQHSFRNGTNAEAVFMNLAIVTYSILYVVFLYNMFGVLSYELNMPILDVLEMSSSPNFIQCPLGLSHFKMAKFWSTLFFFSNFLVTLRSLMVQSEVLLSAFYDFKPILRFYTVPCALVYAAIVVLSITLTNFDNVYEMIHHTDVLIIMILFPLFSSFSGIFITFFYGVQHLMDDMHFMLGFRPSTIWKMSWYIGFAVYSFAFIYSCLIHDDLKTGVNLALKFTVLIIGAILGVFPVTYFLVIGCMRCQSNRPILEAFRPSKNWGPKEEILRKSRDMFSAHDMTKEYLYRQQRLKGRSINTPEFKPVQGSS